MVKNLSNAVGRRKTAVARVYLRAGSGKVVINSKPSDSYFESSELLYIVNQPLNVTDTLNKVDVVVSVTGGGKSGQAEAIRHGISRALVAYDETNLSSLRANGFMTRDPRMVERKKYGQRGARRRFQFSKR